MKNILLRFAAILFATLATRAANTVITPIPIPNSMETLPYDINDNGDVVGLFYSPGSIEENSAFVMRNGQVTTFKYPGAQYTEAHHIDNNGDIYGLFRTTPADPTYFLLRNNTYTEIDAATYNPVVNVSQDFSSTKFPAPTQPPSLAPMPMATSLADTCRITGANIAPSSILTANTSPWTTLRHLRHQQLRPDDRRKPARAPTRRHHHLRPRTLNDRSRLRRPPPARSLPPPSAKLLNLSFSNLADL